MEHESEGYANCKYRAWYSYQRFGTMTGGLRNKRTCSGHQYNSIVEIGQNTKKSPRDMKRLAVAQTPVKNHQITLV